MHQFLNLTNKIACLDFMLDFWKKIWNVVKNDSLSRDSRFLLPFWRGLYKQRRRLHALWGLWNCTRKSQWCPSWFQIVFSMNFLGQKNCSFLFSMETLEIFFFFDCVFWMNLCRGSSFWVRVYNCQFFVEWPSQVDFSVLTAFWQKLRHKRERLYRK